MLQDTGGMYSPMLVRGPTLGYREAPGLNRLRHCNQALIHSTWPAQQWGLGCMKWEAHACVDMHRRNLMLMGWVQMSQGADEG